MKGILNSLERVHKSEQQKSGQENCKRLERKLQTLERKYRDLALQVYCFVFVF